jgi:uncharacterized protein
VHLQRYEDVREFYRRAEPFLLTREAEHCLMLGLCNSLMTSDFYKEPPYLVLVEDKGNIVASALRTPPHNLILSEMVDESSVDIILDDVQEIYEALPGVLGPKAVSKAFANHWTARTGESHRLNLAERVYKLRAVRPIRGVSGEVHPAQKEDRDLLIEWFMAFTAEALDGMSREDAEKGVDFRLERDPNLGGLRLWWDDGKPVSFDGYGGPTPNGIRIGPVYTPPGLRGRGYASACVAATSQEMLDSGRTFCFLFTDLSNPTSNRIYQAIGYEPVADVDEYRFGSVP